MNAGSWATAQLLGSWAAQEHAVVQQIYSPRISQRPYLRVFYSDRILPVECRVLLWSPPPALSSCKSCPWQLEEAGHEHQSRANCKTHSTWIPFRKMSEQAYDSLPQRAGSRGRRYAAATAHEQHAHGCHTETTASAHNSSAPIKDKEELKEQFVGPETGAIGRYRTAAEGSACYECERRYTCIHALALSLRVYLQRSRFQMMFVVCADLDHTADIQIHSCNPPP